MAPSLKMKLIGHTAYAFGFQVLLLIDSRGIPLLQEYVFRHDSGVCHEDDSGEGGDDLRSPSSLSSKYI